MQFEYQVGELVCSKWNEDIYQIVKCLPEIPTNEKYEQGVRYFARRITIHKYTFKPEKAILFHHAWLYKNSRTLEKFNTQMTGELKEYLDNVVFEPELSNCYFVYNKYSSAHFVVSKSDFKVVKKAFEEITFFNDIVKVGERLLDKFVDEQKLKVFNMATMTKNNLGENELVCRIDIYRYQDDFLEPNNYLSPEIFRFYKVKKIYIK